MCYSSRVSIASRVLNSLCPPLKLMLNQESYVLLQSEQSHKTDIIST